jgi:hypothetical protein
VTKKKEFFFNSTLGREDGCTLKLFMAIMNYVPYLAHVFVTCNHFHSSLTNEVKARNQPKLWNLM